MALKSLQPELLLLESLLQQELSLLPLRSLSLIVPCVSLASCAGSMVPCACPPPWVLAQAQQASPVKLPLRPELFLREAMLQLEPLSELPLLPVKLPLRSTAGSPPLAPADPPPGSLRPEPLLLAALLQLVPLVEGVV